MAAHAARLDRMAAEAERSDHVVAQQLEVIRKRIEGLQSSLDFQTRLDGRLRDLEIGLVTNKRSIQAIYDSRIWKAFCSLGGRFCA